GFGVLLLEPGHGQLKGALGCVVGHGGPPPDSLVSSQNCGQHHCSPRPTVPPWDTAHVPLSCSGEAWTHRRNTTAQEWNIRTSTRTSAATKTAIAARQPRRQVWCCMNRRITNGLP